MDRDDLTEMLKVGWGCFEYEEVFVDFTNVVVDVDKSNDVGFDDLNISEEDGSAQLCTH